MERPHRKSKRCLRYADVESSDVDDFWDFEDEQHSETQEFPLIQHVAAQSARILEFESIDSIDYLLDYTRVISQLLRENVPKARYAEEETVFADHIAILQQRVNDIPQLAHNMILAEVDRYSSFIPFAGSEVWPYSTYEQMLGMPATSAKGMENVEHRLNKLRIMVKVFGYVAVGNTFKHSLGTYPDLVCVDDIEIEELPLTLRKWIYLHLVFFPKAAKNYRRL